MEEIKGELEEVFADEHCRYYAKKQDAIIIECSDGKTIEIGKDMMAFLASLLDL